MKWALAFFLMVCVDFVWAKYTDHITQKDALRASFYATMIVIFNGLVTIGYTDDHWLLVPTVLGAFVGTYFAVNHTLQEYIARTWRRFVSPPCEPLRRARRRSF